MPVKSIRNPKVFARVAVLGAMGFALMYLEFPFPLLPPFLQYDFGDVPPLLASFAMGPIAGLVSELVKCVIFFLSGKDEAGLVGTTANFVAGGALVVAAGIVYAKIHSLRGSLLALASGTAVMVLATTAANIYIFLPLWGIPADQIMPFILTATIPFNLAKGVLTSVVTFLFYKRVRGLLQ